jgi:DNA-3-methyladenine glycosylase II
MIFVYDCPGPCHAPSLQVSYLVDLAAHFDGGRLTDEAISGMDDEALVAALTAVKGIGRWSVDMFLMSHLGRPDVLPVGDLGIRKGFQLLHSLKVRRWPMRHH